ncbi:hypothetical protein IQ254_15870 [Nodosilinea sp. LEGE 07088]|nr:hypothetical protein [Nodosilinea sp. LEGE 07088]MBE9138652.1 hypothetical protein [Nodosilinea sp. LEGE 07088]
MNKTSDSSNSLASPESGATDSLWQPSWWHWLISALSGTVETEKQTAWLRKSNERLRKSNEALKKSGNDLRSENERLAELQSKIDGSFSKHGINLPRPNQPEQR